MNKQIFYKPIDFLPKQVAEQICVEAENFNWYQGWAEKYNKSFRDDLCVPFYKDQVWHLVRRKINSTNKSPVDWIYRPFRLHRFSPGGMYDSHNDVIISRKGKKIFSDRTRTILIVLQQGTGIEIQAGKKFTLDAGQGLQIPVEQDYSIHVTKKTGHIDYKNFSFLLTLWGMRNLMRIEN